MGKGQIIYTELTRQIKRGEQSAFEILFKLNHESLINFARVYVKNIETANEIVQETFIKTWEIRSTLNENLSIKAFLFRCVHNNCINYLKKAKTIHQLTEEYSIDFQHRAKLLENEYDPDFTDRFSDEGLEEKIRKTIDSLPHQCREIFILNRFEKMSYAEIAQKLNLSINTIKTQLQRAIFKLREALK